MRFCSGAVTNFLSVTVAVLKDRFKFIFFTLQISLLDSVHCTGRHIIIFTPLGGHRKDRERGEG